GDDSAGDLVQPVEHGGRIADLVGLSRRRKKAERTNHRRAAGGSAGYAPAERDHRVDKTHAGRSAGEGRRNEGGALRGPGSRPRNRRRSAGNEARGGE